MRLNRAVLLVAVGSLLALMIALTLNAVSVNWPKSSPLAGDPFAYRDIADEILSGSVPYIDVTVEHLPLMLVPILGVGVAASGTGIDFPLIWPLATITAMLITVLIAGRIRLVDRYQWKFAVAVVPMLPLALYRLEVFVVLLVVLAIAAFADGRHRDGSAWAFLGALAKGWPVILCAIPFRRGATRVAIISVAASVACLGIVAMLPGFREGRAFSGIHAETLVGNALLLIRHATGSDLGLIGIAGATYVEAPAFAVVVNAVFGVIVGGVALASMFRTRDLVPLLRICGLATLAIILISPLFSAQFLFWLTPFIPLFARRGRRVAIAAGFLSMLVAAFWNPFEGWWALEVGARNVMVLAVAYVWISEVLAPKVAIADLRPEHVS